MDSHLPVRADQSSAEELRLASQRLLPSTCYIRYTFFAREKSRGFGGIGNSLRRSVIVPVILGRFLNHLAPPFLRQGPQIGDLIGLIYDLLAENLLQDILQGYHPC